MKLVDLTNQKFGKLLVIKRLPTKNKKTRWLCQCDCGTLKDVSSMALRRGVVVSCGVCSKIIDLRDQKFGRLTVVKRVKSEEGHGARWLCQCQCGNFKDIDAKSLKSNKTRSCGCYQKKCAAEAHITHGLSKMFAYTTWQDVHQRCYNPNNSGYKNYGRRGITVCWRWHRDNPDGFINFYIDIGYKLKPGDSIERLDNDLSYSPENCDVIPKEMQAYNRRCNKIESFEEAEFIRDVYFNHNWPIKNIAEFFRCSTTTISYIVNNKAWVR